MIILSQSYNSKPMKEKIFLAKFDSNQTCIMSAPAPTIHLEKARDKSERNLHQPVSLGRNERPERCRERGSNQGGNQAGEKTLSKSFRGVSLWFRRAGKYNVWSTDQSFWFAYEIMHHYGQVWAAKNVWKSDKHWKVFQMLMLILGTFWTTFVFMSMLKCHCL